MFQDRQGDSAGHNEDRTAKLPGSTEDPVPEAPKKGHKNESRAEGPSGGHNTRAAELAAMEEQDRKLL